MGVGEFLEENFLTKRPKGTKKTEGSKKLKGYFAGV